MPSKTHFPPPPAPLVLVEDKCDIYNKENDLVN